MRHVANAVWLAFLCAMPHEQDERSRNCLPLSYQHEDAVPVLINSRGCVAGMMCIRICAVSTVYLRPRASADEGGSGMMGPAAMAFIQRAFPLFVAAWEVKARLEAAGVDSCQEVRPSTVR